jgi:hypothetical protein
MGIHFDVCGLQALYELILCTFGSVEELTLGAARSGCGAIYADCDQVRQKREHPFLDRKM